MKTYRVHLKSISPYSQSKLHCREDGTVFIPSMQLKNCLSTAAKYLNMKITGRSNAIYTKKFEDAVMILRGIDLPIKKDDVPLEEKTYFVLPH